MTISERKNKNEQIRKWWTENAHINSLGAKDIAHLLSEIDRRDKALREALYLAVDQDNERIADKIREALGEE